MKLVKHRLNCEELESRRNPSVVSVAFTGGNLNITGDNAGNIFTLQENVQGAYFMTAGSNTFLNGAAAIFLGSIRPVNIYIRDGNGSDHIQVIGVRGVNIFNVQTGTGNDFVNLAGVSANYVGVFENFGNNTLETTNVVAHIGASLIAGNGFNEWIDNSLSAGVYLNERGWSEIIR